MENKLTQLWNKIKITRDTFGKIALLKEFDELVTKYKNELITKFQREKSTKWKKCLNTMLVVYMTYEQ